MTKKLFKETLTKKTLVDAKRGFFNKNGELDAEKLIRTAKNIGKLTKSRLTRLRNSEYGKLRNLGYVDSQRKKNQLTKLQNKALKEGRLTKTIATKLKRQIEFDKKILQSGNYTIKGSKRIKDIIERSISVEGKGRHISKEMTEKEIRKLRDAYQRFELEQERLGLSSDYRRGGKSSDEIVSEIWERVKKGRKSANRIAKELAEKIKKGTDKLIEEESKYESGFKITSKMLSS